MDRVFKWYGGVPRHVLEMATTAFKEHHGDEDKVLKALVQGMNQAIHKVTPVESLDNFNWHGHCPNKYCGLVFEMQTQRLLQEGRRFQVRQLGKGDPQTGQNITITFSEAGCQTFKTYKEVDLHTNVFWKPCSPNLASIDLLRGPAIFFQITVSKTHPIKHEGLNKALKLVDKSESSQRL
ncbi:hypothetical protein PGTUg99_005235 [Puccinia graminis f. sp. tritici]|nr:hypothetical protein PGTUg99_005235 [Puccinia graminis f. sp. tritici]